MFQIKQKNRGAEVFITHTDNPLHIMRLANLDELAELHTAISDHLASQRVGDFIGSSQAQEIAKAEGYDIPITTLVNACARGTLSGAHKRKGRWFMPRENFNLWFQEWKSKQAITPTQDTPA